MNSTKNLGLKWSCLITNFPFPLLKNYDFISRSRVASYGIGILLVILLDSASAYVFCTQVLKVGTIGIILGVIIVALIMFFLERIIIHSSKNFFTSCFRIALSVFSAIIFSIGIDIYFFSADIAKEVAHNRLQESKRIEKNIDSLFIVERRDLENNLKNAQFDFSKKDSIALEELEHKGRPGWGKIYDAKRIEANRALHHLDSLNIATNSFNSKIVSEKVKQVATFKTQPVGVLEKIKALHDFVEKDFWAKLIYLCLFFFFILLDLTVLFTKIFSRPSSFEVDQITLEKIQIEESEKLLSK
jgi:Domain of unknown function (DUF4407)